MGFNQLRGLEKVGILLAASSALTIILLVIGLLIYRRVTFKNIVSAIDTRFKNAEKGIKDGLVSLGRPLFYATQFLDKECENPDENILGNLPHQLKICSIKSNIVKVENCENMWMAITNYRLIICENQGLTQCVFQLEVPLMSIGAYKIYEKDGKHLFDIVTKDIRMMQFQFENTNFVSGDKLIDFLEHEAFKTKKDSLENIWAWRRAPLSNINIEQYQQRFSNKQYYGSEFNPNNFYQVDNRDYNIVSTYPPFFYLPKVFQRKSGELKEYASNRSSRRIPAVVQANSKGVTISRSSQPRACNRSKDRILVKDLQEQNTTRSSEKQQITIADARSRCVGCLNTCPKRFGGYECCYRHAKLMFMDIGNIHVMRNAQLKLFSRKDNTKNDTAVKNWLSHIELVLRAGRRVQKCIQDDVSVLIHCTDGQDRTAQISILAQIMVDPQFRTTKGFIMLIEKDGLQFGHKFSQRLPSFGSNRQLNLNENEKRNEISPIFIQMLECVQFLVKNYPDKFQFGLGLLLFLAKHFTSGLFTSFFYDNEKEREGVGLFRLKGIFDFIKGNLNLFARPGLGTTDAEFYKTFSQNDFKTKEVTFQSEYYNQEVENLDRAEQKVLEDGTQLDVQENDKNQKQVEDHPQHGNSSDSHLETRGVTQTSPVFYYFY